MWLWTVSEEKLDEKREVEFQRMLSEMSNEEVAQSQNEYLQLWEDGGGLNSLTPTDDWESRDPDTPDNELEDDSQRIKTGIKKTNKCKLTSPPPPPVTTIATPHTITSFP